MGVGRTHERAFHAAYDALGCLPPSIEPRATGHVTQMVELMERLIERGHAYAGRRRRLLRRALLPRLRRAVRPAASTTSSRARPRSRGKRDPRDFTLWKAAKPGEPSWPTPWGRGRPGLAPGVLGDGHVLPGPEFDIHGGGIDLVFPHHENERAQSQGAAGDRFARFWLHNAWVTLGGEKMSKSLGNTLTIDALLRRVRGAGAALLPRRRRTTARRSSTPTPRCSESVAAYRRIESFVHRVRERVGTPEPGSPSRGVRRGAGRRPGHTRGARRDPHRRPRGQHRARRGRPSRARTWPRRAGR